MNGQKIVSVVLESYGSIWQATNWFGMALSLNSLVNWGQNPFFHLWSQMENRLLILSLFCWCVFFGDVRDRRVSIQSALHRGGQYRYVATRHFLGFIFTSLFDQLQNFISNLLEFQQDLVNWRPWKVLYTISRSTRLRNFRTDYVVKSNSSREMNRGFEFGWS